MNSFKLILLLFALIFQNKSFAQKGCTDPSASNFNIQAKENDGSCIYTNSSINPLKSLNLSSELNETSGLIFWNSNLLTHNDDNDTKIHSINPENGNTLQKTNIKGVQNIDWEDIAQDSFYFYLGDFGNNVAGNRTNLRIYKIKKDSFKQNVVADTIHFSYSNQTNFNGLPNNETDFDCEAFIVTDREIILFTKQWTSQKTSIYVLNKEKGRHVAQLINTLNVNGLITGATFIPSKKTIALCGYSKTLQPFFYLIYDLKDTAFTKANKRKIEISLPFHQIEGIASQNGLLFYVSNEAYSFSTLINTPQKLHHFDLSPFLLSYYNLVTENNIKQGKTLVYPNPFTEFLYLDKKLETTSVLIYNHLGILVKKATIYNSLIDLKELQKGWYFIVLEPTKEVYKILKQ